MGKNRAISIGINKYEDLTPLKYAKRDAELMQDFLRNQAGFDQVLFFSDNSPDIGGKSTRPSFTNLNRVLRTMFEKPFMEAGDNFWFFFSGHGRRHNGCDYLMASDSTPEDVERTAISISYVTEQLRRCGADNVILILDACRDQGSKSGEGIGNQAAEVARQKGIVTFFSCSPNQLSYEIEALQQGAFTKALLEGLGIQGKCATVERLNNYLSSRVTELIQEHKSKNVPQTPYVIAEPVTKSHLILCPQYATLKDVATLKTDAYEAEVNKDYELAEQLWIRVLAASPGGDMDAIKGVQRIAVLRSKNQVLPPSIVGSSLPKLMSPLSAKSALTSAFIANAITISTEADVPLKSKPKVDYKNLRDLLAAKKWQEADQETARVMFNVAGRDIEGWLDKESIEKFPCDDLRTIDQLWLRNSNGELGFTVQNGIYQSLKPPIEYNRKDAIDIWEEFGDCVSWRQFGRWMYYKELFHIDLEQEKRVGYLPLEWSGLEKFYSGLSGSGEEWYFFSRFETCFGSCTRSHKSKT